MYEFNKMCTISAYAQHTMRMQREEVGLVSATALC